MYVCELEAVLKISQPRISQHLRVLKEAFVLKESKEAQKTFYIINWVIVGTVLKDFDAFLKVDIKELPYFHEESKRIELLESDGCVVSCKVGGHRCE